MQSENDTHSRLMGYLLWIFGFTGAHRFYFGKPLTGLLWLVSGGLFLVGWLIDVFLIPRMADKADHRFREGALNYDVAWLLLTFLGVFGIHRFYQGKLFTGFLYLISGGLLGIGWAYDFCTLNTQLDRLNRAQ